jgi:hypothetical protein
VRYRKFSVTSVSFVLLCGYKKTELPLEIRSLGLTVWMPPVGVLVRAREAGTRLGHRLVLTNEPTDATNASLCLGKRLCEKRTWRRACGSTTAAEQEEQAKTAEKGGTGLGDDDQCEIAGALVEGPAFFVTADCFGIAPDPFAVHQ